MKRLNGWQRIGVIASIVWILAGWLYTYNSEFEKTSKQITTAYLACRELAPDAQKGATAHEDWLSRCWKETDESWASARHYARIDAALVAFVPVPLGWGFAYLALVLVRWVRRGFVQA